MAIIKKITNTTRKRFVLNWNLYKDNIIMRVKTLTIHSKALNQECSFADEADFQECRKQNLLYFINGNLLVGDTNENEAVSKNESNATQALLDSEQKITQEVANITEQATKSTRGRKPSVKLEVTTEKAGE